MTFAAVKDRWTTFAASPRGRGWLKAARTLFVVGVLVYLGYEILQIGWREVLAALPTNPLFYLIYLVLYFMLPVVEVVLYRITWDFAVWRHFPVFLKKRIFNKDVLGYSGELYFYTWARRHLPFSDRAILKTIRDQNVVSSIASTAVAAALLAGFLYLGELSISDWLGRADLAYVAGGVVVAAVLVVLGVRLRKYFFSMPWKTARLIFAIQAARSVAGQALMIAMWAAAMPEVGLRVWFTYSALSIIVTRLPFIPNRDLIFLGAGVSLAGSVAVSEAGIAGMLAVTTVLGKVLNFVFFALLSWWERHHDSGVTSEDQPGETEVGTAALPEEVA